MNSVAGVSDDSLPEETIVADLERECNEETCDWAEAFEIFGDTGQTDDFMYNRLHQCEIKEPCFNLGSDSCHPKWDSYWCQCLSGWYGKDCDFMDTQGDGKNTIKLKQVLIFYLNLIIFLAISLSYCR